MIRFVVKDKYNVECRVTTDVYSDCPNKYYLPFTNDCGNAVTAELFVRHLRDEVAKSLRVVREEAYNQGWKDKRLNKKKCRNFIGCW